MNKLYASVTGTTGLVSIDFSNSHSASTASAVVVARETDLSLGSRVTIDLGYTLDYHTILTGYLKQKEYNVLDGTYSLTFNDILVRAVDYFIVGANPETPLKYKNILAEDLVKNVLALANLTSVSAQETNFTLAINADAEVAQVSSYDYCRMIGNIITYNLWAENDVVYFKNRKPYVMTGATGQPGDVTDETILYGQTGSVSVRLITKPDILSIDYSVSERDLRNRIVVTGSSGISAESKEISPYLPNLPEKPFYKSVLVAAPYLISTQEIAKKTADYNLALLNKLTETLSISMVGDISLNARQIVTVDCDGFPEGDGNWYVFQCEHSWSRSGFITTLELRR